LSQGPVLQPGSIDHEVSAPSGRVGHLNDKGVTAVPLTQSRYGTIT
jgi:hypothetical protein